MYREVELEHVIGVVVEIELVVVIELDVPCARPTLACAPMRAPRERRWAMVASVANAWA